MAIEKPIDPPEDDQCRYCGDHTDNGSMCEQCEAEQKADFNED